MHFANPFYFLLGILIAGVILLYFFRKQYHSVINPSNLLWIEAMNEWQASPWLKKLQHNLLFWLQLAALALLMIALVKPVLGGSGLAGEHLVFVVDPSSSMSAESGGESRFTRAKNEMLDIAQRLDRQQVTIILAGEEPEIIINREGKNAAIKAAIDSLQLTYEHENISDSVRLAASLSSGSSGAVHIFSDGVTKELIQPIAGNQHIIVHNVGEELDNLALLSFGAARSGETVTAVAVAENQGNKDISADFRIVGNEETVFEKRVELKANSQEIIDIPNLPDSHYYRAEIAASDKYLADNSAATVLSPVNPPVYAIGDVNPFLLKGLNSIGITSVQLDEKSLGTVEDGAIFLVEGEMPATLPEGPILLINNNKEDRIEMKEQPKVSDSPLLEYAAFEKTYIQKASQVLQGQFDTIAESGGHPLIQSGRMKGQPAIIVNFAIEQSDWPLQPGFPIFLYNSYQWLSSQNGFLGNFQPGEERWLSIDTAEGPLELFDEKGRNLGSFNLQNENFKAPYEPGIYQAVAGERVQYFSVLLDDREKKPVYENSFSLNESGDSKLRKAETQENGTAWLWLGSLALLILLVEWEVFRRGL
ncbi:hypothetical protein A8F94_11295 [Bacillus sp. FJAT-27225]|uniref:vWA domain-containing protein n=1 Tax=Bacillus sp. FJAT-27225 TaxID=1743144 RepID=UPI00080C30C6|nr:VWA domain-containing protein [Bacillus sp. FJAT-27225]OCA85469.1 hypothetical protein A8F94_11295 [Bacillus sp. FJAT-27225]